MPTCYTSEPSTSTYDCLVSSSTVTSLSEREFSFNIFSSTAKSSETRKRARLQYAGVFTAASTATALTTSSLSSQTFAAISRGFLSRPPSRSWEKCQRRDGIGLTEKRVEVQDAGVSVNLFFSIFLDFSSLFFLNTMDLLIAPFSEVRCIEFLPSLSVFLTCSSKSDDHLHTTSIRCVLWTNFVLAHLTKPFAIINWDFRPRPEFVSRSLSSFSPKTSDTHL